jgi:hypothetical protein
MYAVVGDGARRGGVHAEQAARVVMRRTTRGRTVDVKANGAAVMAPQRLPVALERARGGCDVSARRHTGGGFCQRPMIRGPECYQLTIRPSATRAVSAATIPRHPPVELRTRRAASSALDHRQHRALPLQSVEQADPPRSCSRPWRARSGRSLPTPARENRSACTYLPHPMARVPAQGLPVVNSDSFAVGMVNALWRRPGMQTTLRRSRG